jgi:heterodisulfide reductase subunit B
MKFLYYPGCSVKGTAREYEESFLAVAPVLGIQAEEMKGWNCCGATVAKSVDRNLAQTLPVQNFRRPNPEGLDWITLCPSCHINHQNLLKRAETEGEFREELNLSHTPRIKQILEVLAFDLGPEEVRKRVRRPLRGIRVLPFYGCLVVRPFALGGKESMENPQSMEKLIDAMGAEPVFFPDRLDCCGGGLLLSKEKTALNLGGSILLSAKRYSPDCLLAACPLCHFMLDAKQRTLEQETREKIAIPVLYLTQLLGLALGIDPLKLSLPRLITSPRALLKKIQASG